MSKRTRFSYEGERVGVMAIDAGGTTGVCWGDALIEGSTADIVARSTSLNRLQVNCVDREWLADEGHPARMHDEGAIEITAIWNKAQAHWLGQGISTQNHFFVMEDFVLRDVKHGTTDRTGIAPCSVNNLVRGFLLDKPINWVFQTPSEAKTRWTYQRLRTAGLWLPNMPHAMDATRHWALWIVKNR